VSKLTQRIDVAEKSGSSAESNSGAEVFVTFGTAAAVELYNRKRVKSTRV
jgi:hypothetical protein